MISHITEQQANDQLDYISKVKDKNERLSWKRKLERMERIINVDLPPLDEQIVKLHEKKQDIVDEIVKIRKQMVKECVHPKEWLVHKGHSIVCKFCNVTLSLPINMPPSEENE